MSPSKPAKAPATRKRAPSKDDQILSALTGLTALVQNMEARLQQVETVPVPVAPAPAAAAPQAVPAPAPMPPSVPAGPQRWFIRIKPYNKKIGHVRRNQYFQEIGRVLHGGTGELGDIPEWVEVPEQVALSMTVYRQRENNINSPQTLDIVTEAEREYLDRVENSQRMSVLGLSGLSPTQALAQAKQAQAVTRQLSEPVPAAPPARQAPALIQGAAEFTQAQQAQQAFQEQQAIPAAVPGMVASAIQAQAPAPISTVPPPPSNFAQVETLPANMAGRAAALQGVPAAPAPVVPAAAAPMPSPAPIPGSLPAESDGAPIEDFAEEAADLATSDPGLVEAIATTKKQTKGRVRLRRGKN